jgi:hypothetical protein
MIWWRLFIMFFFLVIFSTFAHAEDQPQTTVSIQKDIIRLVTPEENSEIISKKPEIKVEFLEPIDAKTLLVVLDSTDITQLITVTDKGFEYKPFLVLPAGSHNLSITATDKEGSQLHKTVSFTTRHTKTFEEAHTDNELSVYYETVLEKPDEASNVPYSRAEGNLKSDTKIKEKEWEFTFNTNVRYLDQSLPVVSPLKKGFDLANWIFKGSYTKDDLKIGTSIGDIQINETPYTVSNLARRGGMLNLENDVFQLNAFTVKSEQVFGLVGGAGIDWTTDDHILGVSAGVNLFDKKVQLKTIYVTGGEPGSSFGIYTTPGAKKGEVTGLLMTTDLFENKLMTEFETDFSKFDPDTSDEFRSKNDKACRFKVGGFLGGIYTYEAMYEYIGRDYEVIGNQGLQKDKQGVSIINGLNLGKHNINLLLSRYNDNVRDDDLFPRMVNYVANIDYTCNEIQNLPIGISYQKSIQDSSKEPSGIDPIDVHTDTVMGRINYTMDNLNLGFQTAYSLQNDKGPTNSDTTSITYTFTPSYVLNPNISVNSSFFLNQSKFHLTDVWTDTYTINLDLRTRFFNDRLTFDVGGTYNIIKADDDSADNRNLSANFRLAYNIKDFLKGYVNPTIALRSTYTKVTDKLYSSSDRDEFVLFLVLATTIPFSF